MTTDTPPSTEPMSFGEAISRDDVRQHFTSVSFRNPSLPHLGFRLVLPVGWKQSPLEPVEKLDLDRFDTLAAVGASARLGLQVLGTLLPWEVSLVDWLEFLAWQRQVTIRDLAGRQAPQGVVIHAVGQGPDASHLRLAVTADGPHVLLLLGRATGDHTPDTRHTLGLAAASLDLLQPSGQATREPVKLYRDRDRMFQLEHPVSWTAEPVSRFRPDKAAVDLRAGSQDDTLAYLRVEALRTVPLDERGLEIVHEHALDEVKTSGVAVADLQPIPAGPRAGERQRWLGSCKLPGGTGQVAMLHRPARHWWLSAVLVCPDRTVNPYAWMRGKRAFEMAVATLAAPD